MNVQVESSKDAKGTVANVLAVTGEIDMHRSPELRKALIAEIGKKPKIVAVDLAGVTFMDSSGVATLVEAMKLCKAAGCALVLCCLTAKVNDVFALARLDKVFKIVAGRGDIFG